MKKIINLLPAFALVIASVAAVAFTVPDEDVTTRYWFDYQNEVLGDYMGTSPTPNCPETFGDACELGFDEEDVIINGNDVQLKPGVDHTDADDDAFKL